MGDGPARQRRMSLVRQVRYSRLWLRVQLLACTEARTEGACKGSLLTNLAQ